MRRSFPQIKIAGILLVAFLVLFGWSVSSPPGSSPDDDYHLASSYCGLGTRSGLCEPGMNNRMRIIPTGLLSLQNCYLIQSVSAACLNANLDTFKGSMTNSSRLNTDDFYPGLFYWANGYFVSGDIQISVTKTRVFNILFILLLFSLTYHYTSYRIRKVVPITVAVCSLPLGLFIFSSNNPSSWSVASLFSYAFLLASIELPIFSKRNLKLIISILFCALTALGSRPDSIYLLPLITLGVFLFIFDGRRFSYADFLAIFSVFLITPIFYLLRHPNSKSFIGDGFIEGANPTAGVDVFVSNVQSLPQLLLGGFGFSFSEVITRTGHLGWFNTPVPPITSVITFSVFLILISASVKNWTNAQKRTVIYFISIFIFIGLFVHQRDKSVIGQDVQPRYFLVFIFLILGFSLIQERHEVTTKTKRVFVISLGLAHSLALYLIIKRYSVGYGDFGFSLDKGIEWWSFSAARPSIVWLTASVAFLIFLNFSISNLCNSSEDSDNRIH